MKELTLIDCNALIHRAYHALPPLTAPDGQPVQALYGIAMVLLKLKEEGALDYAAAVFDRPEPTFRKQKYAEYKATRPPAPEPLIAQIISAHHLFEIFGIKVFEKPGYEADDCIATLTTHFKNNPEINITILTGDMDALQLVEDPNICVRAFRKGVTDTVIYDEAGVRERLGVPVKAVTAYKALIGDTSDNVKGVNGIGPKGAAELLANYNSINELYEHIDEFPKYKAKLLANKEQALLSEELVILDRKVPIEIGDIESLQINFDKGMLAAYFEGLGFKRLLARLEGKLAPEARVPKEKKPKKPKKNAPTENQASMF